MSSHPLSTLLVAIVAGPTRDRISTSKASRRQFALSHIFLRIPLSPDLSVPIFVAHFSIKLVFAFNKALSLLFIVRIALLALRQGRSSSSVQLLWSMNVSIFYPSNNPSFCSVFNQDHCSIRYDRDSCPDNFVEALLQLIESSWWLLSLVRHLFVFQLGLLSLATPCFRPSCMASSHLQSAKSFSIGFSVGALRLDFSSSTTVHALSTD